MEFYTKNQVIFLTGGTGFVGKCLVEKILRSLPQVQKIYLLVRASNKTQLQKRIQDEIFGCRLFEPLKAQFASPEEFQDKIVSKVVAVQGDLLAKDLGLDPEDKKRVQADTQVVLSCAAEVGHFHPLRHAINANCYGPLRILKLAQGMPQLTSIVHVSTSYVNFHLGPQIQELLYPYPLCHYPSSSSASPSSSYSSSFSDPDQLLENLAAMTDDTLSTYEREVALQVFPNTYVMSKSLAEHLVQSWSRSMQLPMVIVRPAAVTGSLAEPMPGWAEGMVGFHGIMVQTATAQVREWVAYEQTILDIVPVDWVCKTILMAATEAKRGVDMVPIFQSGTSAHHPITLHQIFSNMLNYWRQAAIAASTTNNNSSKNRKMGVSSSSSLSPMITIVDTTATSSNSTTIMATAPKKTSLANATDIQTIFYNPTDYELCFRDRITRFGRGGDSSDDGNDQVDTRKTKKLLAQAYKNGRMYSPFLLNQWFMDASNAIALDNKAPPALFSGLTTRFDWEEYMHIYCRGVHQFILKEEQIVDFATMKATWMTSMKTKYLVKESLQQSFPKTKDETLQVAQNNLTFLARL
ncbi:cyclin-dependent kinase inhibitor far1 [Podila minutissima]|uniref:Fatty acyl-CoA reductase n=1 Tax=Podila minutissima TaxID=64525 RepID=A0A9P5SBJ5_9FUNG|nr:cyclin-dependent kinase inhibitor far1 [Podila minutissima]